ncbi:MAG: ROK family protein [Ruminococcaceae bacterium]|nr:ROK family protein [Oscillospiraceae bacterium]
MYYIGIDLGGTNIATGIVDEDGKIISKNSVKTEAQKGVENIVEKMSKQIELLLEQNNIPREKIGGVGIGSPGSIDSKNGVVIYSNNIRMENFPLVPALKEKIDFNVYISNDANCAALGEAYAGAAKGYKHVLLITLGTGVGGGVIIDGKIFEGSNGTGAELGHTMLIMGGEPCTCGRNGCWESYASATALIRQTKRAIEQNPDCMMAKETPDLSLVSGRTAFDFAKKGDAVAQKVVDTYLVYVAEGLVDFINVFRPEIVLVGGGISHEGEYIFAPILKYLSEHAFAGLRLPMPPITRAQLGNDAGIVGAAMLCKK